MPKVPIITDRDVEPQGFSGRQVIDAPLDAFGAAQGRALSETGRVLGQVADTVGAVEAAMRRDVDEARARDADAALSRSLGGILRDPDDGALSATGRDAVHGAFTPGDGTDAETPVRKRLTEAAARHADGLDNDNQRAMYGRVAERRIGTANNAVLRHGAGEAQRYFQATILTRIDALQDEAVRDHTPKACRPAAPPRPSPWSLPCQGSTPPPTSTTSRVGRKPAFHPTPIKTNPMGLATAPLGLSTAPSRGWRHCQ